MTGLAAAADAAPGAATMVSAADVPGSTTWTFAAVGAVGSVPRERTWYFEAPVTMYGLVPPVVVAAARVGSGPLAGSRANACHWLQVTPDRVRIWNWSWVGTAFLGQVTATTVTAPETSWTGVWAPARAVTSGSGAPGVLAADEEAPLATRIEATEDATKPRVRVWLFTGCALACEESCGNPVTIGATASALARARTRPRRSGNPAWGACPGPELPRPRLRFIVFIPIFCNSQAESFLDTRSQDTAT